MTTFVCTWLGCSLLFGSLVSSAIGRWKDRMAIAALEDRAELLEAQLAATAARASDLQNELRSARESQRAKRSYTVVPVLRGEHN